MWQRPSAATPAPRYVGDPAPPPPAPVSAAPVAGIGRVLEHAPASDAPSYVGDLGRSVAVALAGAPPTPPPRATPAPASGSGPSGLPIIPSRDLTPGGKGTLGTGAFGNVDHMLWRSVPVAMKLNGTNCADEASIDNERRLYEKLKDHPHDHILPVYGICTDAPDGKVRLVMKFCEKGSLDRFLVGAKRAGGLPLVQLLTLLSQVISGLHHLHSLGILHRDLRAANILIASLDPLIALLADFGVSHHLSAFAAAGAGGPDVTASAVTTVLRGAAALGPAAVRPHLSCWLRRAVSTYAVSSLLSVIVYSGSLRRRLPCSRTGALRPPLHQMCTWWVASCTSC